MADVTVTLAVDGKQLKGGLDTARRDVEKFSKGAETSLARVTGSALGGGAGGGKKKMDMRGSLLGMQLQDVAVQAQMGTSALTIFSQQAPQILSAFGNLGAIVGGFAAVGGAAYTFGKKSSEAFRTVLNDASALNSEIAKLAGSGATLESSLDAFTRIKEVQKEISGQSASRQDGGGLGQMSQELLAVFGLAERNYDQANEAEIATAVLKKQQVRLQNEIVKASANEVKLAALKAAGDDKAVDALDRKLKLEAQIQKIKSFGLDAGAELKLIENATRISELQAKQEKNTYDIAKNIQDQVNAAQNVLSPYKQFLDYLDQAKTKQDAITKAAKETHKAEQLAVETKKNAAQSIEDELQMMAIKATGNKKGIEEAEKQQSLNSNALRVQKELGVTSDKAMEIAKLMASYQKRIDGGAAGRIQGFSRERAGLKPFFGLDGMASLDKGNGSRLMKVSDFGTPFKGMQESRESVTPVTRAVQQLEQTMKEILQVD